MPGKIRFNISDDGPSMQQPQEGDVARLGRRHEGWPPNSDDDETTPEEGDAHGQAGDDEEEEEEEPLQIEDYSSNSPFEKLVNIIERSFHRRASSKATPDVEADAEERRRQMDGGIIGWKAGWRGGDGVNAATESAVLTLCNWNEPKNVMSRAQSAMPAFEDAAPQQRLLTRTSDQPLSPPEGTTSSTAVEDVVIVLPNPLLPAGAPQPQDCAWALEWCRAAGTTAPAPSTAAATATSTGDSVCGQSLRWSFPLLATDDAVVVRPLDVSDECYRPRPSSGTSPHPSASASASMFHPQLALSAATSAAECIRREVHRQASTPTTTATTTTGGDGDDALASSTAAAAQRIAPALFVPMHHQPPSDGASAVGSGISGSTNGRYQAQWLGTRLSVDNGTSLSAFHRRAAIGRHHRSSTGAASTSSIVQRFRAESLRACPAPCRFVGDVVEMMQLQVGLKCRVLPLHLELQQRPIASTAATGTQKQQQQHELSHRSGGGGSGVGDEKRNAAPLRSLGGGSSVGSVWVTVEHSYQLAPSKRRCDWEDVLEAHHLERQLLLCGMPSVASSSSPMPSSSAALYGAGLPWGTSVNPVAKVELTVAWPWSDASSIVDSTVKSSFDITTPSTPTATGTGSQSLAPTVVLARLSRTNRFELSRRASGTLSEVAYATMHHCSRIADDLTAQSAADLRAQQSTHRRISPVELATLAMAIFGEDGPLPPIGCEDDVRAFVCDAMPSVLGSPRYFVATRHIFNRFAKACSLMEDPDDMHSLWVALIDKLRTVIDFDVSGNGAWRYFIDPGQRASEATDSVAHAATKQTHHVDPGVAPPRPPAIRPLAPMLTAVGGGGGSDGDDATEVAMDLEAPLVMQKLQLLWSTGALLAEHEAYDDAADEDSDDVGAAADVPRVAQSAAAAHRYGWDEDDELLFDCDDEGTTTTASDHDAAAHDPHEAKVGAVPRAPQDGREMPSVVACHAHETDANSATREQISQRSCGGGDQPELLCAHRTLVAPPAVPYPLMTRDQIEAQERDLLKLGSNRRAESTRRWIMSQHLAHEMALFLYVNQSSSGDTAQQQQQRQHGGKKELQRPKDVTFADFVRWHSPRDYVGGVEGAALAALVERFLSGACSDAEFSNHFISCRMQQPSHDTTKPSDAVSSDPAATSEAQHHVWWSLWRQAKPKSLRALKQQMYTLHESIAVTLDWLENHYTLEELLGDVFLANVMNAVVPMVEALPPSPPPPATSETDVGKHRAIVRSAAVARRLALIHSACRRLERPGDGSQQDRHTGGWSTADADNMRLAMKRIIGHVEVLEDDAGIAFSLRRLLFGGSSPTTAQGGPVDANALLEGLMSSQRGCSIGAGSDDDLMEPAHRQRNGNHSASVAPIPLSLWHRTVAPTIANRCRPQQTASAVEDDDGTHLSLRAAHCHLVCVAERPVGASVRRPLLQSMHCTWSWDDALNDGEGASPVPETRAREGWTPTTHPTFYVRCALTEEVQ